MSAQNSLTDNSPKDDFVISSEYALHVALQTMKERCISIQNRLNQVEEENLLLRNRCGIDGSRDGKCSAALSDKTEVESLRKQVTELGRQKCLLSEHIAMVGTENRQLWSRLSKLAKDRNKQRTNSTETPASQNLIRSKTFTQHSPNPNIRQKLTNVETDKELDDFSLEEVSLKVLNDFDAKTEGAAKTGAQFNRDNSGLGFGYLTDDTAAEGDVAIDARKCMDSVVDMKKELMKQQSDLKVLLSSMKDNKSLQECPGCKTLRKPEMTDKVSQTGEALFENYKRALNHAAFIEQKAKPEEVHNSNKYIDILEQKRLADEMEKMCPLCGRVYSSNVPFTKFQEHVEMHLIDETESDPSIERNFEFISHAVGNF